MPRTQQIQLEGECVAGGKKIESFFKPGGKPGFSGRPKRSGSKKNKKKHHRKGQQHHEQHTAAVPVPVPVKSTTLAVQPVRVEDLVDLSSFKVGDKVRVYWSMAEPPEWFDGIVEKISAVTMKIKYPTFDCHCHHNPKTWDIIKV